jgi:FtsH-binding integral membrane protein
VDVPSSASASGPPPDPGRATTATRVATILSPLLVGLAAVTWLWSQNRAEFEAAVVVRPAIVVASIALVLLLVFRLLAGRLDAASFLTSLALVGILGYGTAVDVVTAVTGRGSARVMAALRLVDIVALGVAIVLVLALARRGHSFGTAARFVGFVGAVIIAFAIVRPFGSAADLSLGLDGAGAALVDEGGTISVADEAAAPRSVPVLAHDDAAHPDVYYVILDGYARADALARHYGFDNTPFLNELRERGFVIADLGTSNYPYTYLSLASSLNERYLTDEIARDDAYRSYITLIRSASVPERFRERGYRYDLIRSAWAGTSGSPLADEVLGPARPLGNEFEAALLDQSLLRGSVPQPSIADYHLAAFNALEAVSADPRPTFAFSHIVAPHPPYVLDRVGNVVLDTAALRGQWGGAENEHGYIEQVRFVNDRTIEAIDRILAASTTRPIIVLQGDHGTWSSRFEPGIAHQEVETERMSNLNAYLVPDAVRALLYPEITPVNTFRAIDRGLFGEPVELLPDEQWYGDGGPPSNLERYVPSD